MKPKGSWLEAATVLSLLAGGLFVVGLGVLYEFYAKFRVGLLSLDIPNYQYMVYGWEAIKDKPQYVVYWISLLIFTVFSGSYLCSPLAGKEILCELLSSIKKGDGGNSILWAFVSPILIVVGILWVLCIAYVLVDSMKVLGMQYGDKLYQDVISNPEIYNRAIVVLRSGSSRSVMDEDGDSVVVENIRKDLLTGCYRVLIANNDTIYLFGHAKNSPPLHFPTLMIPKKEIELMEIVSEYAEDRCNLGDELKDERKS